MLRDWVSESAVFLLSKPFFLCIFLQLLCDRSFIIPRSFLVWRDDTVKLQPKPDHVNGCSNWPEVRLALIVRSHSFYGNFRLALCLVVQWIGNMSRCQTQIDQFINEHQGRGSIVDCQSLWCTVVDLDHTLRYPHFRLSPVCGRTTMLSTCSVRLILGNNHRFRLQT